MNESNQRGELRTLGVPSLEGVNLPGSHSIYILNREQVTVQGIVSVESFDDKEIVLETDSGTLMLRGEDLHIKQLDLESGRFSVEGFVSACTYSTPRQRGRGPAKARGFLDRLLR